MTDKLTKAIQLAALAHSGQTRKYSGLPYIVHPLSVMSTLLRNGITDVDILSAAVLHDVVEDTNTTLRHIQNVFGRRVAQLVEELTEPEHSGNRLERKAKEAERLGKVSVDAQTIKCADLIDNTADIAENDPAFAKVYIREKAQTLLKMSKADQRLRGSAFSAWFEADKKVNA